MIFKVIHIKLYFIKLLFQTNNDIKKGQKTGQPYGKFSIDDNGRNLKIVSFIYNMVSEIYILTKFR